METQTQTIIESSAEEPCDLTGLLSDVRYPDSQWSDATVNYYKSANEPPPDTLNSLLSEHEMRMARRSDESPHITPTLVRIRNIRNHEREYNIDKQGFTIAHVGSIQCNWRDDEELKRVYFPRISELLKRTIGAKEVVQYEWHVRSGTLEDALETDSKGSVDINGPVRRAHIDESPKSAKNEYNHYVLSHHGSLEGRPFGIYNVWKPLKTVRRDPLCLCDPRTIQDQDLQLGKVTVPNVGEIENFAIKPPKVEGAHGFVYLRGQQPDEALVFRIYDERVDGIIGDKRSHGVAHTSFLDPGTEGLAPRESIEVRSFCVF